MVKNSKKEKIVTVHDETLVLQKDLARRIEELRIAQEKEGKIIADIQNVLLKLFIAKAKTKSL